jgi:flagellar basal body-associated protein FliL
MRISRPALATALALLVGASAASAADRRVVVMPVPGQPYFVQLTPVFVPVIEGKEVPREVSLALAIEIADGAKARDVERMGPILRNALLDDVYTYVQQRGGIGAPEGEVALKERLAQTAQRVLGPIEVKEVEIEEFFQQRR